MVSVCDGRWEGDSDGVGDRDEVDGGKGVFGDEEEEEVMDGDGWKD